MIQALKLRELGDEPLRPDRLRVDAVPIIPDRRSSNALHAFSPVLYRMRNRVERFFNKLRQFRRIATRCEKLAANYLAMIKIAAIRIWLRFYKSRQAGF